MEKINRNNYHFTTRGINFLYDLKSYLLDFKLQFNGSYGDLFRQTYFNNDFIFVDKKTKEMYFLDFNKYDVYTNNHHSSRNTQTVSTIIRKIDIDNLIEKKVKILDMNRDDADF